LGFIGHFPVTSAKEAGGCVLYTPAVKSPYNPKFPSFLKDLAQTVPARYTLLPAAGESMVVTGQYHFLLTRRTGDRHTFSKHTSRFSARLPGSSSQHCHQLFLHRAPWCQGSCGAGRPLRGDQHHPKQQL